MRFNIRSHSSCALSDFPSMMHLKRHIKAFHSKSGEGCRHCGAWFRTIEDLNQHVAQPLLCEPGHAANRNPEDGISQTDLQTLFDKKVQTWHDMWLIIFPDLDRDLPYPGKIVFGAGKQAKLRAALDITKWDNGGFRI
ncbi:hypothetical protein FJTKL_15062 [Diaporthe vaccinii]|uniref:C2H2-type domain-containing protein n=1 Tax=Diaporthe vaccinii TaxID=105482 RepID=A0ABR4E684_9PEZI